MVDVTADDPDYAKPRAGVDLEELHGEMLARHATCRDYWDPKYRLARDDMRFAFMPDEQWDTWMTERRKGRPMYTVNKLRQAMKQITNEQRQNRPQVKVRAVEDADSELAEIRQGLIRNIDATSDADRARDTAFQFAVGGGFGVWRISTAYEDDGGFDQVIKKEEISDPYSVYFDPASKSKDRRDARYAFVDTLMARSEFKERWPDADLVSVNSNLDQANWWTDKDMTVAEYWYKQVEEHEICLLSTGETVDADSLDLIIDELAAAGVTIQRRRMAERTKVYQCIVSGTEILEGPTEWPGRYIPLVPVWGELLRVDGEDHFFGAVRFGKDAQRMYNFERSAMIEIIDDQGYSPFMADAASVEGYETQWQGLRTKRPPVLLFNSDPSKPNAGVPIRLPTPEFPSALATSSAISSDDLKAATGIYDASVGARSNETSGRAILARQQQGNLANFDYIDNLSFAIKYDFEITNDLITAIYDTQRQVRIIGDDAAEKIIAVNKVVIDQNTGMEVMVNDLSRGRYDIAVTVGPNYATQRMEAVEVFSTLLGQIGGTLPPQIAAAMAYNIIKNMDLPGSEDVDKAFRKMLIEGGVIEPGDDDEPPQPQQPPPDQVAKAKKDEADANKSMAQGQLYAAQAQGEELENLARQMTMQALVAPPMPQYPPAQVIPAPGGFPG